MGILPLTNLRLGLPVSDIRQTCSMGLSMATKNSNASRKILALDLGGSKMLSAIVTISDGNGARHSELSGLSKRYLSKDSGREGVWKAIISSVDETIESSRVQWNEIDAIGTTIPGVADPKRGYWVYAPFSGIHDFPIGEELSSYYDRPVFADNDVNACAWGEKVLGVCQDVDNFLWITISNGIGGGLVLNGQIYPGKFSGAAEIGHFNVVKDGIPCGCGNRGCLEATAAGPGIALRYREYVEKVASGCSDVSTETVKEWNDYLVQKYEKNDVPILLEAEIAQAKGASAASIAEEARRGNPIALAIYQETGSLIGRAASWAANLINPEKIVIGGGVSGSFDLFYPALWDEFQKCVFRQTNQSLTIEKTGLGYLAGLMGAAALAFDYPYK